MDNLTEGQILMLRLAQIESAHIIGPRILHCPYCREKHECFVDLPTRAWCDVKGEPFSFPNRTGIST